MQNISKMSDRLMGYGRVNRAGETAIQHQVVFIRTAPLGDEDLVDNNYSSLSNDHLLDMLKTKSFTDMVAVLADTFEENVANINEQFFSVNGLCEAYETFRKGFIRNLPDLTDFRIEIRAAQVFSQNVYYFVKNNDNIDEVEDQFRKLMADNGLPAETVNLSFNSLNSVSIDQLYELMTIFSILLREAAKEAMFVPGRVIGNFNQITKGSQ